MTPRQDRDMSHLHQLFRGRAESWLAAVRKAGFQVQVIGFSVLVETLLYIMRKQRAELSGAMPVLAGGRK